ncbi:hypothetical protein FOA52_015889 [Chlamydomonas sp. UWO 241]|nr:hypothetical protein FOA52_015889 [Chlamydomonas sp. UWO 241]
MPLKTTMMPALAAALHAAYSAELEAFEDDDDDGGGGAAARIQVLHERCVALAMGLVSTDELHGEYLALYAQLALERGRVEDAVRVALRLIVRQSKADGKGLLAACLVLPGGMDLLYAELGAGGDSAAALAFLGNAVKEHGAVAASVELFAKVASQFPTN